MFLVGVGHIPGIVEAERERQHLTADTAGTGNAKALLRCFVVSGFMCPLHKRLRRGPRSAASLGLSVGVSGGQDRSVSPEYVDMASLGCAI